MSVRSAARGNPAAKSIRFALRTSSIVATSSANFSRCVLRWLGSRRLRSALMLSAIRVMPSTIQVLGPLKAKSLNHTPTPAVNPDLPETDGWQEHHLKTELHDKACTGRNLRRCKVSLAAKGKIARLSVTLLEF